MSFSSIVDSLKNISSFRIVVLLVFAGLIIGGVGYVRFSDIPVEGDALGFKNLGQEFASGEWISSKTFGEIRTPGYPVIVGAIYAFFGNNDLFVKVVQVVVFAMIAVLIFVLGQLLFNRFVGLISAIWYLTYYDYVRISYLLMREIWITLFILLTLYFYVLYIKKHRPKYLFAGSVIFGYLTMIDPRYCFFLLVLLVVSFILSKGFTLKIRDMAITLLGLAIFLVPWSLRQSSVYGTLVVFSPVRDSEIISAIGLPHAEILPAREYYPFDMKRDDYLRSLDASGLSKSRKNEIAERLTNGYLKELRSRIPQSRIRMFLHRFLDYWRFMHFGIGTGTGNDVRLRFPWSLPMNLSNIVHLGFLLPFLAVGVYLILRRREVSRLLALGLLLYHMSFHIIVHYLYRYRFPILPVIFLIGWFGFDSIRTTVFYGRPNEK